MARAGTMTRLAADADLDEVCLESICLAIVVLAHTGRVAIRAHEVPVLRRLRPMQLVVVRDALVRIEMEPALTATILRSRVPRDRERLHAASRQLDQVLLQRRDAKGVLHLE